jgi:hypothetical protein
MLTNYLINAEEEEEILTKENLILVLSSRLLSDVIFI